MRIILIQSNRIGNLLRLVLISNLDASSAQQPKQFSIKSGHRHGRKGHRPLTLRCGEARGGGSQNRTAVQTRLPRYGIGPSSNLAWSHREQVPEWFSSGVRRSRIFPRSGSTCAMCDTWLPTPPAARRASIDRLHSSRKAPRKRRVLARLRQALPIPAS